MNGRRVSTLLIIVGLGISLQASGDALAKDQVTRPLKITGNVRMVVSLIDGSAQIQDRGQSTHIGRFTNLGDGELDLDTGNGWARGTMTAANGDQISWNLTSQGGTTSITFAGGTGRFEGVTGGFTPVRTGEVVKVDLETMTMTITHDYTAVGTITY